MMPLSLSLSITKTIQVRWTRHAGHCWRSRDELISDVLLWTPTHGWAKAGWPARTYIQQLCEDTGCSPEDLPEAMNDREKWWERVRDIRATSTTCPMSSPLPCRLNYGHTFPSFSYVQKQLFQSANNTYCCSTDRHKQGWITGWHNNSIRREHF